MKFYKITGVAAVLFSTLLLGSCGADPDSPGLEYMPDMYRSAAIEPYVDYGEVRNKINEDLKMGISALVPPSGTIPYYGTDSAEVMLMLPFKYAANEAFKLTHGMYNSELSSEDTYAMAAEMKNPLTLTEENADAIFAQGKYLFNSRCAHCHGEKGDGNGPMMENGTFAGVPDYANVKNLGDGQLFYSIYYGKGAMGAHGSILNKKEIWTLVHYIRKFQFDDYGPGMKMADEAASDEEGAADVAADNNGE